MKKTRKVSIKLAAIFLAMALVITACGGNTDSDSNSNSGSQESGDKPTEVTIMSHFLTPTPPAKGNPVEKKIEELTNTKLNIQWVSGNNYTDKLNVTLASGQMPDLLFINDPFSPTFRKAVEQGAFWDIGEFIDDYPNLKATISETAWELTKINGKNYTIPRPRPAEADTFFIIRKDWLDQLGLDVPTTSDELYAVMEAFTKQDPDQNGKDDTIGFAGYVNPSDMGNMGAFEGIFTGAHSLALWKDVDGELVFTATLPEMREALEYLNNAYNDGLIPADFASLKVSQVKDMFKAGKAGIVEEKAGSMQQYYDALVKINPELEFTDLYPLTNVNGVNPKGPGFAGANAIPKSVPEEKVRKILEMYDTWVTDEVFSLHRQGIEGVHHTVENGEIVLNTEKLQADAIESYNQIVYVADPYASSVKPNFPEEAQKLYAEIQDERAKTSVADVSIGLHSETAETYLPELKKDLQDMKTKVILGAASLEDWDKFVEDLKNNANFIKMTEEMNEAYQNR